MATKTQKAQESIQNEVAEVTAAVSTLGHDLRTSILIVSVVANLFVFTTWIALQVTSQYDTQIAQFLFTR